MVNWDLGSPLIKFKFLLSTRMAAMHPLWHQNAQMGKNTTASTFSLLQLENYIVENMKSEMVQLQQNAVQNHTATMLEIGTSLLSQTAEQTRKLTDVETQVCSQHGFQKAVNCREHFPNSFLSNALPHKTFQHRSPGNTLCFLVITALVIDPCYVSFHFIWLVHLALCV